MKAPIRLSWDEGERMGLASVARFLARFHTTVFEGRLPVVLDMRTCTYIDTVSCMLLTAEVERCLHFKNGSISVRPPTSAVARAVLEGMGFYRCTGLPAPSSSVYTNVLEIQTGDVPRPGEAASENPSQYVYDVAKVAMDVFDDEEFADRVHAALNEAADNIISWAYPTDGGVNGRVLRRWWVGGVTKRSEQIANFLAYDLGVGIPATAPRYEAEAFAQALGAAKVAAGLTEGAAMTSGRADATILENTIRESRTRSLSASRGKGLAQMIELIDLAKEGHIWIFSGWASYSYSRYGEGNEPLEGSRAIGYKFPGTLVVWSVSGPRLRS